MSSVDGRLLPSRWSLPYGDTSQQALFRDYALLGERFDTDAWMFGKATVREFFPEKFMSHDTRHAIPDTIFIGDRYSRRLFITVDYDADIMYDSSTLRGDNIVTILKHNATVDYLDMLENKGISYIVINRDAGLRDAMEVLYREFGIRSISLQGGGIINGAMLADRLIDELSLVMYPGIDGLTTSPSIFEYLGASDECPASGQSLELSSVERLDSGIVWIRYLFHR